MLRKLLIAAFILPPFFSFSQLKFQDISFEEAINKSKQTGQLIFLQVESPTCLQCNEVANKAFENEKLSGDLQQIFICLRITADHPDRQIINSLYNMQNGFGSLFIGNDKTLIHKFPKTTTRAADYKEQMDIALQKAGEDLKVSELEKEYNKGNKSPGIMESLLLKRKTLNLQTDSLLEEYTSLLPPDSLTSERTLLFIAQMAPLVGSKPDLLLRKNFTLFNKIWYSMNLPLRASINNQVIYRSMQKAIKEKNEAYAYRIATFARGTNTNAQSAAKAFESNMIMYYKETNDIKNYLIRAVYYYDNYYMTVKPDSVKLRDSLNRSKLFSQAPVTTVKKGDSVFRRRQVAYLPITQMFTRDLNNGAWNIYTMTKDSLYLQKALEWAKRANEFFESPEAMDTYARLLYKTGNPQQALEWMNKAILVRKKQGFDTKEYEAVLSKMKNGNNKIDTYQ